jgi:hypothetical protein
VPRTVDCVGAERCVPTDCKYFCQLQNFHTTLWSDYNGGHTHYSKAYYWQTVIKQCA